MDEITRALERPLTRRTVLKAGALAAAGAAVGGLATTRRAFAQEQLAPTTISLWHQQWDPIDAVYAALKASVEAQQPNVTVEVTPLPYDQLLQKVLPSVAAGNEADIMMVYSSWLVASAIEDLFLPVAPGLLSVEEANGLFYPAALSEGLRGDGLYYLPFLNGMGGSTFTYNKDHLEEAGIDGSAILTWDDLVQAGKELVQWDGDDLVRAGVAFSPYIASAWVTGIQQMGGSYYDAESGKFNLTSEEAKAALNIINELLTVHKVDDISKEAPSHANMTGYGAADGFGQGLASITNFGSWIVSGYESSVPGFRAGVFATPYMADTTDETIELGHNAVHVLSRRLADDPDKAAAAAFLLGQFATPENFFPLVDAYGGSVIIPAVAQAPEITERNWGSIQQEYDKSVWPRARFEEHHVPDWNITVAWPQLYRIFNGGEAMDGVLQDLENESNLLEQDALDRLGI
jgi:ABC-type glycerol-3-phosphate transport system substrate-binding protein